MAALWCGEGVSLPHAEAHCTHTGLGVGSSRMDTVDMLVDEGRLSPQRSRLEQVVGLEFLDPSSANKEMLA